LRHARRGRANTYEADKELDEDVEAIILTGSATLEDATEALQVEGDFDYVKKSLDSPDKLIHTVNQAMAKCK
jgi:DNA-binding NtrC family response regulator